MTTVLSDESHKERLKNVTIYPLFFSAYHPCTGIILAYAVPFQFVCKYEVLTSYLLEKGMRKISPEAAYYNLAAMVLILAQPAKEKWIILKPSSIKWIKDAW